MQGFDSVSWRGSIWVSDKKIALKYHIKILYINLRFLFDYYRQAWLQLELWPLNGNLWLYQSCIALSLGFDNNLLALNFQTNKLINFLRKQVLTVHLYSKGWLASVFRQPLTGADLSQLKRYCNWPVSKSKVLPSVSLF